jgi:hypothetical protein
MCAVNALCMRAGDMSAGIGRDCVSSYSGSCHCGAVTFRVDTDIVELTTCDCSLCTRKNALMTKVHESALTIVSGQDVLSLYQWNTRRAQHYFCSRCASIRSTASARSPTTP